MELIKSMISNCTLKRRANNNTDQTSLILNSSNLDKIPKLKHKKLNYLDVSNNHISSISPILRFSTLVSLNLGNNELRVIPDEIEQLAELRVLSLVHNKLKHLPAGIKKLKLLILSLDFNELRTIPIMPTTKIYAANNKIKFVPIMNKKIYLENNPILDYSII